MTTNCSNCIHLESDADGFYCGTDEGEQGISDPNTHSCAYFENTEKDEGWLRDVLASEPKL